MSKRKGREISGWIVLDKPVGKTSTQGVGLTKRLFRARKAGHAGTLDPLATGILPIALGEATKTVPFVMDGEKSYRFTVSWGRETSTDDGEGEIVAASDLRPSRAEIEAALDAFVGEIMQVPPRFSAIKVSGERAYDLARDGEDFELAARPIRVERLEIADLPSADLCVLEADCGKGCYVRALARDLGRALGCRGYVSQLRRTRVGPFGEADALDFDTLQTQVDDGIDEDAYLDALLPCEAALDGLERVDVGNNDAARLLRGQAVLMRGRDAAPHNRAVYAMSRGVLLAVGEIARGELRPQRVFNLRGNPTERRL